MSQNDPSLAPPERLRTDHDLSGFECGEPTLNEWLRRRALQNEASGASRTYVLCAGPQVAGYYSLAVGAIAHAEAAGRVRRNMPDPIPVMVLARLAVHEKFQGKKIGRGLLRDAVLRTLQVAEVAGVQAILAHALSERAGQFYEALGFVPSPVDRMTLMMTLGDATKTLLAP